MLYLLAQAFLDSNVFKYALNCLRLKLLVL